MATIRPNDNAPDGDFKVILPTATFDLSPGGSYETEDRSVLYDAQTHPWLTVEYPEVEELSVTRESTSVPYEDDYLAAVNSKAFDPEEIAKVENAKRGGASHLAVDAGLDQGEPVKVGDEDHEVGVTLAADDADNDDKPARKTRTKKED